MNISGKKPEVGLKFKYIHRTSRYSELNFQYNRAFIKKIPTCKMCPCIHIEPWSFILVYGWMCGTVHTQIQRAEMTACALKANNRPHIRKYARAHIDFVK